MNLEQAILYALEQKAILFAGSGFSYGAKNFNDESFKQGDELKSALLKDCGSKESTAPLSTVADFYAEVKSPESLVSFLRTQFNVKSIADWHAKIMSIKWKRVYTTNYDSVIESSSKMAGIDLQPMLVSEETSRYNLSNVCIHLNGYIDFLNTDSLNNEFKLTDYSYSCDSLEGKPGFEFMKNDFKSAKAIIFIGYSLNSDIDILRLLSSPRIAEKTIFIDKENADEVSMLKFKKYGTYYGIGIKSFAQKLAEASEKFVPQIGNMNFESFLYENMTPLCDETVEYDDLINLFILGNYKESLCSKEHFGRLDGNYKYLVERKKLDLVLNNRYNYKVFLVTSDLGNGKSIFCNLIRNELRSSDVHVFTFREKLVDYDEEIANICQIRNKPCFVILDNYQSKFEVLKQFAFYGLQNITFVLTARKSVNAPNFRKLITTLKISETDIMPVYLDKLEENDVEKLSNILSTHNLLSQRFESSRSTDIEDYMSTKCHSRFSDLLLDLFNSSNIKKRIYANYQEISKDSQMKKVVIFALLKSSMNLEVDFIDFLNILKLDYASLSAKDNIPVNEFLTFTESDVKIKSSIIAKELLLSCVDMPDIFELLREIIFSADNNINQHQNLLQNIVSHTHYSPFIKKENGISQIKGFYNSIRNTKFCSNNPFFWEQFAASCIEAKDFIEANQCLAVAFVKAKEKEGFVPFQIETIKSNCIIEELLYKSSFNLMDSEHAIQSLVECHKGLLKYFTHPDNNIKFIFRVGKKYVRFFELYKNALDSRQKSIFMEKKAEMKAKMEAASEFDCPRAWIAELDSCKFSTK